MNNQNVTSLTPATTSSDFTVDTITGEAYVSQRKAAELLGVHRSSLQEWVLTRHPDTDISVGLSDILLQETATHYAMYSKSANDKAKAFAAKLMQAGAKAYIYDQAGFKMKAEQKTPQTFLEAMQVATRALEALEAAKPAIKFHSEMFTTNARCSMNQFAKLLTDSSGVKIGQNKMMEFLRKSGYLMVGRDRNERNRPYQKYMEAGWFEVDYVKTPIGMTPQTFITALGQTELSEHILAKFS